MFGYTQTQQQRHKFIITVQYLVHPTKLVISFGSFARMSLNVVHPNFTVLGKVHLVLSSDVTYHIKNESTKKRVIVHFNRLKPYYTRSKQIHSFINDTVNRESDMEYSQSSERVQDEDFEYITIPQQIELNQKLSYQDDPIDYKLHVCVISKSSSQ